MPKKTYRVYAALHDESKEGWIWISPSPDVSGEYVRVKNLENGRSVVSECRRIDANFCAFYNAQSRTAKLPDPDPGDIIVISTAYRDRLGGIRTQEGLPLEVTDPS